MLTRSTNPAATPDIPRPHRGLNGGPNAGPNGGPDGGKTPLRVLHVFKTYYPDRAGGVERVIRMIAAGTRPLGIESEVLTVSPDPHPRLVEVDGVPVRRAGQFADTASTPLSLSVFPLFRERARAVDVIHYHFPWPVSDLLDLIRPAGKPALLTYHSDVVRQRALKVLYGPLMRRFLGSVDRIVATSPNYLASSEVLRSHAAKVEIVPIGLPDIAAPDPAVAAALRARLPERFFLFVGVLRYYKGIAYLADAAERTGLPVVVCGGGETAALRARKIANLHVMGELDEAHKDALLSLAYGFVFPSHLRSEAFGIALLEAARAGKPMISCEIGTGTSHVNLDGETGIVVPAADAAALAAAMTTLWNAPDLARGMGAAARRRFEGEFGADLHARRYAGLYRELAGR